MKRRAIDAPETPAVEQLATVLAAISDPREMVAFLTDLCTPAELEALADRWSVVPMLADGVPYRAIHERTGVSVTTVGRVARCLDHGAGGYRAALAATSGPDRHRDGARSASG